MATENTLKIRNIGRVTASRMVNTPGRGAGGTAAVPVTRVFKSHTIGSVAHNGINGPRRGKFPNAITGSEGRHARRVASRE
jgi:hypothetical protein